MVRGWRRQGNYARETCRHEWRHGTSGDARHTLLTRVFGGFFKGGQAEIGGIHRFDGGTSTTGIFSCLAALFASCLILPLFKAGEFFLTFLELSIGSTRQ